MTDANAAGPQTGGNQKLNIADLQRDAEDALLAHMLGRADAARARHGGTLRPENLEAFLADDECVRFPSRVVYDDAPLDEHQFAQPERDPLNPNGYAIHIRPRLRERPDLAVLAVSYVIPLINYGAVIRASHAERYGARLLGLDSKTYFQRLCELADWLALPEATEQPGAAGVGDPNLVEEARREAAEQAREGGPADA